VSVVTAEDVIGCFGNPDGAGRSAAMKVTVPCLIAMLTMCGVLGPWSHASAESPANVGGPCPSPYPLQEAATVDDYAHLWCFINNNNVLNKSSVSPRKHIFLHLKARDYAFDKLALPAIKGSITIVGAGSLLTSISGSCPPSSKVLLPDDQGFDTEAVYEECGAGGGPVIWIERGGYLELQNVTIRDGEYSYGGGIFNMGTLYANMIAVRHNHSHGTGGGIYNGGYLSVQDSSISSNFAHNGVGGGIYNAKSGSVDISYSTINHNRGWCAGGIESDGSIAMGNSTISNNKAVSDATNCPPPTGAAGGLVIEGNSAWMKNVTITENSVFGSAVGAGGMIGPMNFYNTIIARNVAFVVQGSSARAADCNGVVYSAGGNLIGNTKGCDVRLFNSPPSIQAADIKNQDPRLGPLKDNGGNTCTHALLSGSPAAQHGWPNGSPGGYNVELYDQRWNKRRGQSDIGAYAFTVDDRPRTGLACTSR